MISRFSKFLDYDWIALSATGFLLAFGLIAVYSLSLGSAATGVSNFDKQIFFLVIGLGAFILFSMIDYRIWKNYSGAFYLVGVLLLLAVLFLGKTIRGTSGWFSLGFFNFQPAELVKIVLIISLAKYFSHRDTLYVSMKQIGVSFLYVLIPVLLAAKQPDMGSAMVMLVIWVGMLFLAGLNTKQLIGLVALGVLVPLLSWNMVLHPYQKTRITSFLNPQQDALGSGYNVIQSIVAVGSGGLWGKGLGHGSQSRLNFLPEKHTDFIFAAIAEESGFVGSLLVLVLFGILFFRFKRTADKSRDNFGQLLVGGVMVMIFFQVLVNVGMNLGMMPVAGLSLPLLSYGGSFLIITLVSIGLVQSVWKRRKKRVAIMAEE